MTLEPATAQQTAPGCFGAASVFSIDSKVCTNCSAYQDCRRESHKNLESLRAKIDVNGTLGKLLEKHALARQKAQDHAIALRQKAAAELAAAVAAAPKKIPKVNIEELSESDRAIVEPMTNKNAKNLAAALCKDGLIHTVRASIVEKKNPFMNFDGWKQLQVACQVLIEEGGFTKATLAKRLVADLGVTQGTAESTRTVVVAVLVAFGIVVEHMRYYKLRTE